MDLGTLSADFTELHTIRLSPYMACRSIRGDASRGLPGIAGPIISSTKSKSSPNANLLTEILLVPNLFS